MTYVKLRDLDVFTVNKYNGYSWKRWDKEQNKMLTSEQWQDGYSKKHSISILWGNAEDPTVEVSNAQLGQMLIGVMNNGMSNILGREFTVKTVGTGLETKYFINAVFNQNKAERQNTPPAPQNNATEPSTPTQTIPGADPLPPLGEPIDVNSIPF